MLFRKSVSTTKKFFQKTIQTFKSFLSGSSYERLPKTPPFSPFSGTGTCTGADSNKYLGYGELDKFYSDFTNQWDAGKEKTSSKKRSNNKIKNTLSTSTNQEEEEFFSTGNFMRFATKNTNNNEIKRREDDYKKKRIVHGGKKRDYEEESCTSKDMREGKSCLVAQKLKELEMMDVSNLDHVLDIEEVLHYYSRLTCPAYVDIVDSFFTNMYSEFLGSHARRH